MIPDMNGCELAFEIYKQIPKQNIVLMLSHQELQQHSPDRGCFYACLEKPVEDDVLVALLNDLLIDQLLYPKAGDCDVLPV